MEITKNKYEFGEYTLEFAEFDGDCFVKDEVTARLSKIIDDEYWHTYRRIKRQVLLKAEQKDIKIAVRYIRFLINILKKEFPNNS